MRQLLNKIRICVVLLIIIVLLNSCCIYYLANISSVYDPMKKYEYSISSKDLEKAIIDIAKDDSTFHYKITNIIGHKHYMDFEIINDSTNLLYNINYIDSEESKKDSPSSILSLVGAFDRINKCGGYKIENEAIKKLIITFEIRVKDKIDKKIKLTK